MLAEQWMEQEMRGVNAEKPLGTNSTLRIISVGTWTRMIRMRTKVKIELTGLNSKPIKSSQI